MASPFTIVSHRGANCQRDRCVRRRVTQVSQTRAGTGLHGLSRACPDPTSLVQLGVCLIQTIQSCVPYWASRAHVPQPPQTIGGDEPNIILGQKEVIP
jgi:hypothetical protein